MIKKMKKTLVKWKQEKKEYKIYKQRIKKLPVDYKTAFEGIEAYMWQFARDESMLELLYSILEIFEENVTEKKSVSDIVGGNLSEFCENLLKEVPEKTWMEDIKKRANKQLDKKLQINSIQSDKKS